MSINEIGCWGCCFEIKGLQSFQSSSFSSRLMSASILTRHLSSRSTPHSPAVAHLLHRHKIAHPHLIPATGPRGRLLKGDVLLYLEVSPSTLTLEGVEDGWDRVHRALVKSCPASVAWVEPPDRPWTERGRGVFTLFHSSGRQFGQIQVTLTKQQQQQEGEVIKKKQQQQQQEQRNQTWLNLLQSPPVPSKDIFTPHEQDDFISYLGQSPLKPKSSPVQETEIHGITLTTKEEKPSSARSTHVSSSSKVQATKQVSRSKWNVRLDWEPSVGMDASSTSFSLWSSIRQQLTLDLQ